MVDLSSLQMPVKNQQVADQAAAARNTQLGRMTPQQALAAGPAAAQQAGAQRAATQGQQAVAEKAVEQQKTAQQAQQELFNKRMLHEQQNRVRQETLANKHAEQTSQMSAKGRDIKQKLLDDAIQLNQTERGIALKDHRQLLDYMVAMEMDQQDFKDYAQEIDQAMQEEQRLYDSAIKWFEQTQKLAYEEGSLVRGGETDRKIIAVREQLRREQENRKKKAGIMNAMKGAAMVAAGGAITYFSSGSMAGVGGAMMGSGVKQMAASGGNE